jgi:hypothetical protein
LWRHALKKHSSATEKQALSWKRMTEKEMEENDRRSWKSGRAWREVKAIVGNKSLLRLLCGGPVL